MASSDFLSQVESIPAVSALANNNRKQPQALALAQPQVRDTEYQDRLSDSLRNTDLKQQRQQAGSARRTVAKLRNERRPSAIQKDRSNQQPLQLRERPRPARTEAATETRHSPQPNAGTETKESTAPQSRASNPQPPANEKPQPPAHIEELLPTAESLKSNAVLASQLADDIPTILEPPAGLITAVNQAVDSGNNLVELPTDAEISADATEADKANLNSQDNASANTVDINIAAVALVPQASLPSQTNNETATQPTTNVSTTGEQQQLVDNNISVKQKLAVGNDAELTRLAIRLGVIEA